MARKMPPIPPTARPSRGPRINRSVKFPKIAANKGGVFAQRATAQPMTVRRTQTTATNDAIRET